MKDRIRAFAASIIIILYTTVAFAANADGTVLGPELLFGGEMQIAKGIMYHENVFYSAQSGVGKQSEYYFDYTPNSSVIPIVTNGPSIYGRYNINEAYNNLKANGFYPVGGINADFYSLQTGVPISHCVSDGHIVSKDGQPQDAVGFLKDGSAFVGYLGLYMTINKDDQSVLIDNVNKYRQPYSVYLFTDEFGSQTYDTALGLVVVLSDVSDEIKVEGTATAVVESVDYYQGSTAIPKGKYVISINDNLKEQDNYKFFESLLPGDKVELRTSYEGDKRFSEAVTIMGGSQGRLLNNGVVNESLSKGAAPRTAIGVRADGSSIFYTIDGRQTNHSYGVQLTTLAKRLKELGCVDAINLDGGGSTTCAYIKPGYSEFSVANSPSDGGLRKNANFFFFVNNDKATGNAQKLFLYPMDMNLLTGATSKVTAAMTDENFYPVSTGNVSYNISSGNISSDGQFTATGDGDVKITATSLDISDSVSYKVYNTPTEIVAKVSGTNVNSITAMPGEQILINASAWYYHNELVSQNKCYDWSLSNQKIGTIDENGLFTASDIAGLSGEIIIKAGDTQKRVAVKIKGDTDSPENYHTIDGFNFDQNIITVNITNAVGVNIDKSCIKMNIDRQNVDFDFENGILKYICPEEFPKDTHRISITAQNELGNTSVGYFEILGKDEAVNVFSDTSDSWAKDIITFMNRNGVINGYNEDDGRLVFRPQDSMTRAQFAVMISNYLDIDVGSYDNTVLPYTDNSSLPSWAVLQIKAMYQMKIMQGRYSDEGTYFDPNALLTRAEAATILSRIMPSGLLKAELTFIDKDSIPSWAKDGIAKLVKIKAMNGYSDNTILPLNNITRAECAKLLYSIF